MHKFKVRVVFKNRRGYCGRCFTCELQCDHHVIAQTYLWENEFRGAVLVTAEMI